MHQQVWGYKVEEKIYLGLHERKGLNITVLTNPLAAVFRGSMSQNFEYKGPFLM